MEVPYILLITVAVLIILRLLIGARQQVIGPAPWFAALLLPVLGYYGVFYLLFALFVIAMIVLAPAVTTRGLVLPAASAFDLRAKLFMFCLPLMPMLKYTLVISGLTFFQFTFVNLLSIGLVVAFLRSGASLHVPSLRTWDLAFLTMLAMQIFMDARGNDLTYVLRACVIILFNLGVPYLAISRAVHRSLSPGTLLLACIASSCIVAIVAGFEASRHWLVYENLVGRIHADGDLVTGYAKQRGGLLRARATWDESPGLSMFLGLQFVMLVALGRRVGSSRAFIAIGAMLLVGVFFTLARVGYFAVIVGLLACFFYERRWRALIAMMALMPLVAAIAVAVAHVVPAVAASIGLANDAGNTVDYRSQLFSAGIDLLQQHWLAGVSMAEITRNLDFLRQGEGIIDLVNQPLIIFMRAGLPGGLLYYAIMLGLLVKLWFRRRRLRPDLRAAGCACFAALVALTVSLVTTSYGRNETTYVILLAFGAGLLSRDRPRRTAADVAAPNLVEGMPASVRLAGPRPLPA